MHHVYARGNDRQALYVDDDDRLLYLTLLAREAERRGWRVLAYCLMTNHVHLLIETPEPNLGRGMQRLHSVYAQTFNARHGRSGHLFQGRYGAVKATSDAQVWTATAYVVCNPVWAGLCVDPAEWPWSSHADALARDPEAQPLAPVLDRDRLMWHFGGAGGVPAERYARHVEERLATRPDPRARRRPPPRTASVAAGEAGGS